MIKRRRHFRGKASACAAFSRAALRAFFALPGWKGQVPQGLLNLKGRVLWRFIVPPWVQAVLYGAP